MRFEACLKSPFDDAYCEGLVTFREDNGANEKRFLRPSWYSTIVNTRLI